MFERLKSIRISDEILFSVDLAAERKYVMLHRYYSNYSEAIHNCNCCIRNTFHFVTILIEDEEKVIPFKKFFAKAYKAYYVLASQCWKCKEGLPFYSPKACHAWCLRVKIVKTLYIWEKHIKIQYLLLWQLMRLCKDLGLNLFSKVTKKRKLFKSNVVFFKALDHLLPVIFDHIGGCVLWYLSLHVSSFLILFDHAAQLI